MPKDVKDHGGSIVFTTGKKILLLKRSADSNSPDRWDLPGGRAENGETGQNTAKRETKEECGEIRGKIFYELVLETKHTEWVVLFYHVKYTFIPTISKEHSDWKWVELDKIEDMKIHNKLKEYLKKYLKVIHNEFKENLTEATKKKKSLIAPVLNPESLN